MGIAAASSFEELEVWKKAHAMVLGVYRATNQFPKHELYGLSSQLRRAAVSVPANIAEGFRRRGIADKLKFYNISQASLDECLYYFILASDLDYADTRHLTQAGEEVSRMLNSYILRIRNSNP